MKRGYTLTEVLVAIAITAIVLGILTSFLLSGTNFMKVLRSELQAQEYARTGAAQLEWLFQRWGTGTPCCAQNCSIVTSCGNPPNFQYPPPSSLCITIIDNTSQGQPCDEVWFYANLYGMGFVERYLSADTVAVMSCRLSQNSRQNCYHIKRGGLWAPADWDWTNYPVPPIVSISGLSQDNLDCIQNFGSSNATMDSEVTLLNGEYNGSTQLKLESGDLLIRVPHRIHLFCAPNPQDNNRLWLYMEAFDMAQNCNADERPQPLAPVDFFDVQQQGDAIKVRVIFREETGATFTLERTFGRR